MRVVDNAVFAALEDGGCWVPFLHEADPEDAPEGALVIHDGFMQPTSVTDPDRPVVVRYRLPYAVYYSSPGDDDNENSRLIGRYTRRSVFFAFQIVGGDRWQVKWAAEEIRGAVTHNTRLTVPGYRTWPTHVEGSQRVRRDDDAIRPDGKPLFYGVDDYALSIALNHQGVLNG